jgi:hypothetical protein
MSKLISFKEFLNESNESDNIFQMFKKEFGENVNLFSKSKTMLSYRCETTQREALYIKMKNILNDNNIQFNNPTNQALKFGFDIEINGVTYRYFLKPPANKKTNELAAEDFEIVACVTNNLNFSNSIEEAYDLSGAKRENKNYELIMETATAYKDSLGQSFSNVGINEPLVVTTRGGDDVTGTWQKYFEEGGGSGKANKTPKTDIFTLSENAKISVKKGAAQLLSSGSGETYATFKVASKMSNDFFVDKIKTNMRKYVDDLDVKEIKKLSEDKLTETQKLIMETIFNNKKFKKEVEEYLTTNAEIRTRVAYEAMTGEEKFGENALSTANYMLKLSPTGDEILDFVPITESLASEYGAKAKIDIAFKSSGKNKWSSFRMITEQALEELEEEYLNEGIIDWTKGKIREIKNFFKKLVEKIITKLVQFKDRILEMLNLSVKIDLAL